MPESDLLRSGEALLRRMFPDGRGDLDLDLPEGDPALREWTAWCYGHLMQERGVLPPKTRAILAVSMLAALGEEEALQKWAGGALRLGATREEVREMIITISVYAGYPKTRRALRAIAGLLDAGSGGNSSSQT